MADERDDERTEPATPRRREEARARGQVARSQDLSSAAVLLAAVAALALFGRSLAGGMAESAASVLGGLANVDGNVETLLMHFGGALAAAATGFLPFVATVTLAAVAVNLAQVGFLWTATPLAPDLSRLDPAAGLGRLVSVRGLARLAACLLKLAIVGSIAGWTIWSERARLASAGGVEVEGLVAAATDLVFTLSLRSALALFVLAALEYGYQRWQHERDLRMSKQELREELRRFEGDPKIRERRRQVQREIALQRMLLEVPRATVVITNPTHVAVAVRYAPPEMEAPVVVAKGAELLAGRIRESALAQGIPLVERKDLARSLYASVDVGRQIPPALYPGVAEILAFVFRMKGGAAAA